MTTTPTRATGRYRAFGSGAEAYRAFVPDPLPPALDLTEEDFDLMERANRALGRLDGISSLLPDRDPFLYLYVRKEAVLSSQIEGTQSSLTDLLRYEDDAAPGVPLDDVREVSSYVAALDHGLARLRSGFPLSLRLIREIHGVLLQDGRGANKMPGEFRRSPVWIGGARPWTASFVPLPPDELLACLDAFEKYLHRPGTPVLIKAALAHAQFETIHPFLDGNGRVGRLLITFLLCAEDVLSDPLLLPLALLQDPPRRVLPAAPARPHARRVGGVAPLFFARCPGDLEAGGGLGPRDSGPLRA